MNELESGLFFFTRRRNFGGGCDRFHVILRRETNDELSG
jgi:hypothetical protein